MKVWTQELSVHDEVVATVFVDGREIGAVCTQPEGGWENLFWKAKVSSKDFATKDDAINDLVRQYKESIS